MLLIYIYIKSYLILHYLYADKLYLYSRYYNNIFLLFSLSKLTQLQDLNMSFNELKVESISVIGDMTSLIKLYLACCGLGEVPQW